MLDPTADGGVLPVPLFLTRAQTGFGPSFQRHTPVDARPPGSKLIVVVGIRRIAKYRVVVFPQELGQFGDIGHIRRSDRYGMGETAIHISADVDFQAEASPERRRRVPLLAIGFG